MLWKLSRCASVRRILDLRISLIDRLIFVYQSCQRSVLRLSRIQNPALLKVDSVSQNANVAPQIIETEINLPIDSGFSGQELMASLINAFGTNRAIVQNRLKRDGLSDRVLKTLIDLFLSTSGNSSTFPRKSPPERFCFRTELPRSFFSSLRKCSLSIVISSISGLTPQSRPSYCRKLAFPAIALLVGIVFSSDGSLYAQVATPDVGAQPNRSYSGGQFDHVQVQNGNLYLRVPLESFPQRGKQQLSYSLVANTAQWHPEGSCDAIGNCTFVYTGGPALCGPPSGYSPFIQHDQSFGWCSVNSALLTAPQATWNALRVIDSTGAVHPLGTTSTDHSILQATDGSGYKLKLDSSGFGVAEAYDPSGIKHTTDPNTGIVSFLDSMSANPITINSSTRTLTDTVGRQISGVSIGDATDDVSACPSLSIAGQPALLHAIWQVPGPNGSGSPLTYHLCYAKIDILTDFFHYEGDLNSKTDCTLNSLPTGEPATVCTTLAEAWMSEYVLQSLKLPNGTYWGFVYDTATPQHVRSYGDLVEIRTPAGGRIDYSYETRDVCGYPIGFATLSQQPASRFVTSRTAYPAQGPSISTTYSYGNLYANANVETDAALNDTVHSYEALPGSAYCNFVETSTKYYQGSAATGTLLKQVATTYDSTSDPQAQGMALTNIRPHTVTTTQDGVVVDTKVYSYPLLFTDVQPYIGTGGGGGLLPFTAQIFQNSPSSTAESGRSLTSEKYWITHPDYKAANLLNLAGTDQILDGNSNPVAETKYEYDEGGSPSGVYGNQTSISKLLGSVSTVISRTVYNSQGMPKTQYDANDNETDITYECSGSLQSEVTDPLLHKTTYHHECNSGKLISVQDPNDFAASRTGTQSSYNSAGDLESVSYPDGGGVSNNYHSYALPLTVSKSMATSAGAATTTVVFDGLGRQVSKTAPSGYKTDTAYNSTGQVESVSNPYSSSPSTTNGTTSFKYDALGRKSMQCQPDNGTTTTCAAGTSYLSWSYDGLVTTTRDEAGNETLRTSDQLGRLVEVEEPGGRHTSYGYDLLGNLTSVTQAGVTGETARARSFEYDSFSRLIKANNPETGTICYGEVSGSNCVNGYDLNGNLLAKTDARGIKTSFAYDALSRMISKSYSGTTSASQTLSSCYQYDSAGVPVANGIGRLTGEWTQSNSNACPTSPSSLPNQNAISWRAITEYDQVGRIKTEQQCVLVPCASPNSISYSYDTAGNLLTSTNGLPPTSAPGVTATYEYDQAARVKKVSSSWNDSTHPGTLFSVPAQSLSVGQIAYPPFSPFGLGAAEYGINTVTNTAALIEGRSYDNRGRLTAKTVRGAISPALMPTQTAVSLTSSTFTLANLATVNVHVDCNSACGEINFKVDTIDVGSLTIDGNGNVVVSFGAAPSSALTLGAHTLLVQYLGSASYAPSSTTTGYTVTNQQTTVDFSINPATFTTAEAPQILVHVSCNSACGAVALTVDGHDWIPGYDVDASGNLPEWYSIWPWQTPYLTPGAHTITANYQGNAIYSPSTKSIPITINPIGSQTTTVALSVDPISFASVEDAIASVHVGCNSACGQIQFTIDGNQWVVWSLDANGNTSADTYWWWSPYLTVGNHILTASYLGNSTYAPAFDSKIITVNPIGSVPVALSLSVAPGTTFSTSGDFTFPVHVSCNSSCGFVQVSVDDNVWVMSQPDQNGDLFVSKAWAGNAYFTSGAHTVKAHFLGSSTYATGDSNIVSVTVTP